jgi:(+)-trans-carveol dehydrogenase/(-)-trans-carveol dehydrogenase
MPYPGGTAEELAETAAMVEKLDRRIVTAQVDVRDAAGLTAALQDGAAQLGGVDIVVANAGIGFVPAMSHEVTEEAWQTLLDINATGVWQTCKAATPLMLAQDRGGSMILTSSTAGLKGAGMLAPYAAAKHAVVGLMRTLAQELGPNRIRVNSVHPSSVGTPMIMNDALYRLFRPDLESPTEEDVKPSFAAPHLLPVSWLEPRHISNAVLFLASDEAEYITGLEMRVDAGFHAK